MTTFGLAQRSVSNQWKRERCPSELCITTYNSAVPYSCPLSCFNYDFSLPLTEVLVSLSRLWVHFPTHVQLGANTLPWIQPSLTSLQCDPHLPSLFILSVFSSFSSSMCYLDINDARVLLALTCPVHTEKSPWLPRLHIYVLMVPSPYIVPPPMNLDSRISTSNSTQTMPKSYLPHGEKITLFSLWVGPLSY